ncbi:MAG: hypothetical protein J0L72_04875 [Armatimonadetes bacterium]|nr:hypothetical protein [Armatimonadota bacterium]
MAGRIYSTIALATLCCFGLAQTPLEILTRSYESRKTTPASLLVVQSAFGEPTKVVTKVEMDGHGKVRRTVMQPLRLQGLTSVDDGRTWQVQVPDQKVLLSMPSPQTRAMTVKVRVELINKNYRVSEDKSIKIAGRDTITLVCRAKSRGIPTRRLYLDEKTTLPLRTEYQNGSQFEVLLDTLSVEFPRSLPRELFQLELPEGYKRVVNSGSPKFETVSDAEKSLGFEPFQPAKMPYGFIVEAVEVVTIGRQKVLSVRLSDGLAVATLYQWSASSRAPSFGAMEVQTGERQGVGYAVVSEPPEVIGTRIFEAIRR